ncbi:MAG: STAS domain-containing protein [Clostridia bacterium]|nr:STAS domain-containing protein [Clostridia bacterium]
MRIAYHVSGSSCEISLIGELDHHAVKSAMQELHTRLDQTLPSTLGLDMRQVTFMDSSGIALILALYKRMRELDGTLRLLSLSAPAKKVLLAAGLDKIPDLRVSPKGGSV